MKKERYTRGRRQQAKQKGMLKGFAVVIGALLCVLLIVAIAQKMKLIRAEEAAARGEISADEKPDGDPRGEEKGEILAPEQLTAEDRRMPPISITISAAGDCTLGTDEYFNPETSFVAKYNEVNDPGYFLQSVKPIFEADDLTIINLEGTLTKERVRQDKEFAFKGEPEYVKILTQGSVEAVNMANNHSKDYGKKSYEDTLQIVKEAGIQSFGYDNTAIMDVKGIKVGLVGTYELSQGIDCKDSMIANIQSLREQGAQVIVASFHWGIEKDNYPNGVQKELAHLAIDNGADLVLGHHPHVLQGIEVYKNKNIVYSLANFCFGGNKNPSDKDTMIFQQTFTVDNGVLVEDNVTNVIPCTVSSTDKRNDYQPTPAQGKRKEKILQRIAEYSARF